MERSIVDEDFKARFSSRQSQDCLIGFFQRELYYAEIKELDVISLPRGGVSLATSALGWIQFGIPPETIKDSIRLGLDVPSIYIVPIERFCRDTGTTLGINVAEIEFPAYYNFFLRKRRCTLVVHSDEAEESIRRVFGETLLGPAQFRTTEDPVIFEEEDFSPDFDRDAIPNFQKELQHFRTMPDGKELTIETLLNFTHFTKRILHSKSNNAMNPKSKADGDGDSDYDEILHAEVAVLYPESATSAEKASRSCRRVEIYQVTGGTEYIVHDIDENNVIVGKAKISSNVKLPESMSVVGFGSRDNLGAVSNERDAKSMYDETSAVGAKIALPPTFYPPSFGVTVLGNSHGFDAKGSVSGYVLWVNGRGIMIDPPTYSSATLEREGIRPRTIVGVILTHCHADHDAGAFQKILTGSPVVVITTPTIYKSFIRKYSALSELSEGILQRSHRFKPAIIGAPLRFQGATFHFTYTLHSIPCVGFRVEWRGRSMVFTGDHFNDPDAIQNLVDNGILSKARADDLHNLPLQDTNLLLHEAGIPPIHTPVEVLDRLPPHVKERMYVVHTSDLKGRNLRIAPTGTAGTIRLDKADSSIRKRHSSLDHIDEGSEFDFTHQVQENQSSSKNDESSMGPPIVALRPTSNSDPWFTLNLLSAVPFLSSLNYASTMNVLEAAKVDNFCLHDVVVPVSRRNNVLCVIWEGTCMERERSSFLGFPGPRRDSNENFRRVSIYQLNQGSHRPIQAQDMDKLQKVEAAVWYAGDWTGPRSLQPDKRLSGESDLSETHDIVAVSEEGVKVITIELDILHKILMSGSATYKRYVQNKSKTLDMGKMYNLFGEDSPLLSNLKGGAFNIMEILESNSAISKFSAVQKRHLESLAEYPVCFAPGQQLWHQGETVERAYIIIEGSAFFLKKRNSSTDVSLVESIKGTMTSGLSPSGSPRDSMTDRKTRRESILARFRNRLTIATSLIFTRGNFLGDVSNMVTGLLLPAYSDSNSDGYDLSVSDVDNLCGYWLNEDPRKDTLHLHNSTLVAGQEGCIALFFPKSRLIPFFDEYPGLLLSLLGTQAVL